MKNSASPQDANNLARDLDDFKKDEDNASKFYKLDKQATRVIICLMKNPRNPNTLQKLDKLLKKANELFSELK